MSGSQEITYALDFCVSKRNRPESSAASHPSPVDRNDSSIPRIALLMALAIRFDRLLRAEEFRDYAELARLGRVTRARMTQIMKLLDLAPDIQEQILFLPNLKGLTERNLRPIVSRIDWNEQRPCFRRSWTVSTELGLYARAQLSHRTSAMLLPFDSEHICRIATHVSRIVTLQSILDWEQVPSCVGAVFQKAREGVHWN
jgi:hypothetical protein